MFTRNQEVFLKIQEHALEVRKKYQEQSRKDKVNILNMGRAGTGKTRLAITAPKPVHIDCFDKGGTKTQELQSFIDSGDIIVDTYQQDSWRKPEAYKAWVKRFEERLKMDYFSYLGTYMLDSTTSFNLSMLYDILRIGGDKRGTRVGQMPELQDYNKLQMQMIDWFSIMLNFNCNVIINGHVQLVVLETAGKDGIAAEGIETSILLPGKSKDRIPPLFDEQYISRCLKSGNYVLQTQSDGTWHAETRIGGGGVFKQYETQDLKALLKKAGYPYEDKEPLF